MKNKINLVFSLIISLIIIIGCDGATGIQGKVFDEDGKPIDGAKITLKIGSEDINTETKSDGSYRIFEIHAPGQMTYKLTVEKKGFQTYEQDFESQKELGEKRDVVLIKQ